MASYLFQLSLSKYSRSMQNAKICRDILPGLGNTDMITSPQAIHAVVMATGNPIR
jgi:hypothetical protein